MKVGRKSHDEINVFIQLMLDKNIYFIMRGFYPINIINKCFLSN